MDGSDKRYCFSLQSRECNAVFVFESAIDALSHATLDLLEGRDWRGRAYLSLGGITQLRRDGLPLALDRYLEVHPGTENVVLCLDADKKGQEAATWIAALLSGKRVWNRPPRQGKDYNAYLHIRLGIPARVKTRGDTERER